MAMGGEPSDRDGECNARLFIGDIYGDNHATMRCQLAPGHLGVHQETYDGAFAGKVTVTWENDERAECGHCGKKCPVDHAEYCEVWLTPETPCEFLGCRACVDKHQETHA